MLFRDLLKMLILWMTIFTAGCDVDVYTEQPERPINIPEASLWVGGPDGGVFVFITESDKSDKNLYYAEVYYASGDVAYRGLMRVYPTNSGDFDLTTKESFVAWDGDNLYLSDKRYLKVEE
ncbi:MAG: hypothetical protein GY820_19505 [Gammaproteobacteria bacterium]|nr:hypothetical protein [Gammaproteobacteria bacterium]